VTLGSGLRGQTPKSVLDHCDSQCTAELQGNDCADVRVGTCTGLVQMPPGCYCVVEEDGTFNGLCID